MFRWKYTLVRVGSRLIFHGWTHDVWMMNVYIGVGMLKILDMRCCMPSKRQKSAMIDI